MSKANQTLRDRLLDMDTPETAEQRKYEKEVRAMIEKNVSLSGRIFLGVLLPIGFLFVLFFLHMLFGILPRVSDDNLVRITYPFNILGLILSVTWVILLSYLVVSGRYGRRINVSLVAGIGLAISFILTVVFTLKQEYPLLHANPQDWRVKLNEQLAIVMLFMLVLIGLYLVIRLLSRLEYKTSEKLLQLEYRIADLGEKLGTAAKVTPSERSDDNG